MCIKNSDFENFRTKKWLLQNKTKIVDKVTILEPIDNGIVSQETLSNNIYHRIVHIMKLSTQELQYENDIGFKVCLN